MPRNILPNRFNLKKKNCQEIRRPFIIEIPHTEEADEAGKNQHDSSL
jgi:hypothetical protein